MGSKVPDPDSQTSPLRRIARLPASAMLFSHGTGPDASIPAYAFRNKESSGAGRGLAPAHEAFGRSQFASSLATRDGARVISTGYALCGFCTDRYLNRTDYAP